MTFLAKKPHHTQLSTNKHFLPYFLMTEGNSRHRRVVRHARWRAIDCALWVLDTTFIFFIIKRTWCHTLLKVLLTTGQTQKYTYHCITTICNTINLIWCRVVNMQTLATYTTISHSTLQCLGILYIFYISLQWSHDTLMFESSFGGLC